MNPDPATIILVVIAVAMSPALVSPIRLFWRDMRGGK